MTKYMLTCDNGQEMEMNVNDYIPGITLEVEIIKLEGMFEQLATDKEATGVHPDGWPDPLPVHVTSFRRL